MFLTEEELRELTGAKNKSLQIEQLCIQGIPYTVNRTGHPRVMREVLVSLYIGNKRVRHNQPNFEALNG